MSELNAEAGPTGVKFNIKREVEVATNLTLALQKSQSTDSPNAEEAPSKFETREVLDIVSKSTTSYIVQQVAGAKVLWVDDNPSKNYYERRALEALGIQFTLSTSTKDALDKACSNNYDAIISAMDHSQDLQVNILC